LSTLLSQKENDLEKKMTDTSGLTCLRQFGAFNPDGSWAKNVRGLVNWSDGLVFEEVQVDLEAEGYEVQAFILPAGSVGAPHKKRQKSGLLLNASHASSKRLEIGSGSKESLKKRGRGERNDLASWGYIKQRWEKFPNQSPGL